MNVALRAARSLLSVSLAAAAALTLAAAPVYAVEVLVSAERMLDVRSGKMLANPQVLVRDGRIVAVKQGPNAFPVSATTRRVELPGMTLLPGLIDMHVHLSSDPSYGGYTGLEFGDRFWSVLTVPHAGRTLDAGFTTVRNVGSDAWDDVGLRQAIEAGKVRGPRVVTAASSFGATGGHCDSTYFPPSMKQSSPFNADSPEEGRKQVRELRKHGAQVIKICATGGVFSRNTEPGQQQMTLAEMKAVADETHQWGLQVAAHAHGASGIRDAIRAGVNTIEHASLIDEEGIALAKQHGAWLSMDIYNTDYTQSEGKKNGVLDEPAQGPRNRRAAAPELQARPCRRGEDGIRYRRRDLSPWRQCQAAGHDGALRHDAVAGNPVGHAQCLAGAGQQGRGRDRSGPLWRHDRGGGRPDS